MALLYTNENIPRPTTEHLRKLGHDVTTALEDGRANQSIPDADVLSRATALSRAVVTHNRDDFVELHGLLPEHSGIIVCTENRDVIRLAERIHEQISEQSDLRGQLVWVFRDPMSREPA